MSNNAQSKITVTFEGVSQSLDQALKGIHAGLASTGTEATVAGEKLAKVGAESDKTAHEARNLGEAVRVAADSMELLGVESGSSYIKLQALRHGATDLTGAFGGLKAGLIGGIGLGAAFGGIQFLHEAVVDSIAGEQATNQLQAALRKTPGAFQETNRAIEESSTTWAKFGISIGVLKAAVAQGVGAGINPETIIGQPGKIADLAKALGEDVPTALGEIERGGRGAQRVISRLNLSLMDQRRTMQELANPHMSANDRTQFLLNRVQQTAFAGQGTAGTKGAQGQIAALNASLADLKETVGTSLLPVLTDMVSSFTGMIQGANSMLSAVGGLSTFLQATWKPALIGISTIFLGLKIAHSALGDFIRSRLLGDVSAAAGGFAEEAVQATKASDAIGSIPPVVRTIAMFNATSASAIKDAYLANIARIPGAIVPGLATVPNPMTTAAFDGTAATAEVNAYESSIKPVQVPVTFDTAGALVEPQATPIRIPVEYDTAQAFSEAQATSLKIPVEYDTAQAFNEAQAVPLNVPVTYNTANAFSEATTQPLSVPVTYDTTKAFSEATATPVNVTGKVTGWSEAAATPVSVTGKVTGWTEPAATSVSTTGKITGWSEAAATSVSTKGKISSWSEPAATPVSTTGKVTSWDEGHVPQVWATGKVTSWNEGTVPTVKTTGTVTSLNLGSNAKLNVGGTDAKITPTLDANSSSEMTAIRSTLKTEAAAGGAIPITVKPQWASNAVAGLKAGIAGGIALAITDAIFNGSITIKQVTAPPATSTRSVTFPHGGASATTTSASAPLPVKIVDVGPLGSAMGFSSGHKGPEALNVSVVKIPPLAFASGQSFRVDNLPTAATTPPAGVTPPGGGKTHVGMDVNAHQVGDWIVSLTPDTAGRFAQMVGEVALGSTLGGVIGGQLTKLLPEGGVLAMLKNLVTKGGKDGTGSGGLGSTGDILGEAEALIAKSQTHGGAAPATPSSSPIHYIGKEHVTSLQDVFNTALKTLQIGAPLGAALYGAFRSGGVIKAAASGLTGMVDGAFASIIALISFPIKGLQTTKGKSTGPTVAAAYAGAGLDLEILGLGKAVVGKFSDGVKAGWGTLTQRISALFNDLINAVLAPINALLKHLPGNHQIPLAGASTSKTPGDTGKGGSGSWGNSFNVANINPAVLHPPAHVLPHHAPVVHHHATHHTVHHHKAGDTYHVTVNESRTPRETGDVVLKALSAAAQRKARHGR